MELRNFANNAAVGILHALFLLIFTMPANLRVSSYFRGRASKNVTSDVSTMLPIL